MASGNMIEVNTLKVCDRMKAEGQVNMCLENLIPLFQNHIREGRVGGEHRSLDATNMQGRSSKYPSVTQEVVISEYVNMEGTNISVTRELLNNW